VDRLPVGWDEGPGLVASVWRYRWLVAAVALAGALAGYGFSRVQPVMYEASSRVLLTAPTSDQEPDRFVRNEAALMVSPPVLDRAVRGVKGRVTVKQLRERLVAEPSTESDLVTLRVRDSTAQGAAELARVVGKAYEDTLKVRAEDALKQAVEQVRETQKTLQDQLRGLDARARASPGDRTLQLQREAVAGLLLQAQKQEQELLLGGPEDDPVSLIEQPEVPEEPAQPKPSRLVALGGLLGLVLAAVLAWFLAGRGQLAAGGVQPQPDLLNANPLAAPLLGEIPDFAELSGDGQVPTATDPESPAGAAYRALAASLRAVLDRTGARTVVITSPEVADGKTLTSVNLAVALGESGQHVVLVDADQRHRGLSQLCDLDGQPGLTDLAGEATPIDYCLWLPTFTSIQVIPAGARVTDSTGFLRGPSFSRAMIQVRRHASLIVVDTPSLLAAPDALTIAEQVEGVVLVVRPETSTVTLIEARRNLDAAGTRLLGYVINRSGARDGHQGDGHGPAAARGLPGPVVDHDGHVHEPEDGTVREWSEPVEHDEAQEAGGQDDEFARQPTTAFGPRPELPAPYSQSNGR
jgi:Mrp family chromosome partitioning ATPase/capsular polysaccharide biosynthesis protein